MPKIPLGLISGGSEVCIRDITAPERVKCQLFEQGLVPGSHIIVIKNDIGGPLVVSVKESRLALGRGVAMQILVEENTTPKFLP